MDTIESLKIIATLVDGITTIGFAVWFITLQVREIDQKRQENKELTEVITKQNEQLLRIIYDDLQVVRYNNSSRINQPSNPTKGGL